MQSLNFSTGRSLLPLLLLFFAMPIGSVAQGPNITSIVPSPICPFDTITITGFRFQPQGSNTLSVFIDGQLVSILVSDSTSIQLLAPGNLSGNKQVEVVVGPLSDSQSANFNGPTNVLYPTGPFCSHPTQEILPSVVVNGPVSYLALSGSANAVSPPTGAMELDNVGLTTIRWQSGVCPSQADTIVLGVVPSLQPTTLDYGFLSICQNEDDSLHVPTALPAGGVFNLVSGNGLVWNSSTGEIDVRLSAPGTFQVAYTPPSGTCAPPDTVQFQIQPGVVAAIEYPQGTYCTFQNDPLPSISGGGMFSLLGGSGASINPSTGQLDLTASSPDVNDEVTISYITGPGCPDTATAVVRILDQSAQFNLNNILCQSYGGTILATSVQGPGTFTLPNGVFSPGSLYVPSDTAQFPLIDLNTSGSGPGVVKFVLDSTGTGCLDSHQVNINIIPPASLSPNIKYSDTLMCTGDGIQSLFPPLTSSESLYEPTGGLSLNIPSGNINTANSVPGTYTLFAIIDGFYCRDTVLFGQQVRLEDDFVPVMEYDSFYCQNGPFVAPIQFSPPGGVFSGGPNMVVNSSTGSVDLVQSGTNQDLTVYYELAGSRCSTAVADTLQIIELTGTIEYPMDSVCEYNPVQLPITFNTQGATSGSFIGSSNGLTLDPVTGAIDPWTSSFGTYTVIYQMLFRNLCSDFINITNNDITIYPAPDPSFLYLTDTLCPNALNPLPIFQGSLNGLFSVSSGGCVVDASTGEIDLASSTPGPCTIKYEFLGDCPRADSFKLEIFDFEGEFYYGDTAMCDLDTVALPVELNFSLSDGVYYSSGLGLAIDSVTGAIDPAASLPGYYTVVHDMSIGSCVESFVANDPIEIYASSNPGFYYPDDTICPNVSSAQPIPFQFGGTYSVTSGLCVVDSATGIIDVGASGFGTCIVKHEFLGDCYVSASDTVFIYNFEARFHYPTDSLCPLNDTLGVVWDTMVGSVGHFYALPPGLDIDSLDGHIDPASSTPSNYVIRFQFNEGGCTDEFDSDSLLTVYPPPNPVFSYPTPLCPNAPDPLPSPPASGGTYSVVSGGCVVDSVTGLIYLDSSNIGTCTIEHAFLGDCYIADTFTVDIYEFDFDFHYLDDSICQLDLPSLPQIDTSSGQTVTYPAVNGLSIDGNTGMVDPGLSQVGNYLVTAVLTDMGSGCQESFISSNQIEIYAALDPDFSYPAAICPNVPNPLPLIPAHPADSFFVTQGSCVVNDSTGEIYLGMSSIGPCEITRAFPGDCYVDSSFTVTIYDFDAVFAYQDDSVCVLDDSLGPQLASTGQSMVFSSSPIGLDVNPQTGVVYPGSSFPGTYLVVNTLTDLGSGCQEVFYSNDSMEIYQPLDPSVDYPPLFCPQDIAVPPTVQQSGGLFSVVSGGCVVDAGTGVLDYANSAVGPCVIRYEFMGDCPVQAQDTIEVFRFDAVFNYPDSSTCTLDTPMLPNVLSASNTGGYISQPSMGGDLNPVTGEISPSANSLGLFDIYYVIDSGGCRDTFPAQGAVEVYLAPDPSIDYPSTANPSVSNPSVFCPQDSDPHPVIVDSGGVFTVVSGGCVVDAVTGIIDLASSDVGLCMIKYAFLGDCPIADSATVDIYHFDAKFGYADYQACTLDAPMLPMVDTASNGGIFFTSPSMTSGFDPNTGEIDPGTGPVGIFDIYYVIDSGGCRDTFAVDTAVEIYLPFDPTISYESPICLSSLDPLPVTVDTGGVFRVISGPCVIDPATGEVDLAASGAGSCEVEYAFGGDCPIADTFLIDLRDTNQTRFWYLQDTFCAFVDTIVPMVDNNFVWGKSFFIVSGPFLPMDPGTGTIFLDTLTPATTFVVEYGDTSDFLCPSIWRDTFTILDGTSPNFYYFDSVYCDSSLEAHVETSSLGASVGIFSGDSGLVFSDILTGAVDLAQSSPGLHQITFTPTGGIFCPGSKEAQIRIVPYDLQTSLTYPQDTVCHLDGLYLPVIQGDTTGRFFYTGGPTWLDTTNGAVNLDLIPIGDYTVNYQLRGVCQESFTSGFNVEEREDPAFAYSQPAYCPNEAFPLPLAGSFASPGGIFAGSPGLVIDSTSGKVELPASLSDIYWIYYTTPGRCPSTDSVRLEIYDRVNPLNWEIDPGQEICDGEVICIATSFADTVDFQLNDSSQASNLAAHCFEGLQDGDSILLIHSDDKICFDTVLIPVTVFPVPQLLLEEDSITVIGGSELTLPLTGTEAGMQVLWWSEAGNGAAITPDSGLVDFDANALAELVAEIESAGLFFPSGIHLYLEPITNFCEGNMDSLLVLINPADLQVFIPEVFTPNGDGWNDTWKVQWVDEVDPASFSMEVYNRSYGKVLEMSPLHQHWTGDNLPDGVYRWILREKGGEVIRVGGVTIRRL